MHQLHSSIMWPWLHMQSIANWNIIIKHMTVIENKVIKPFVQSSTPSPGFQCLRNARGLFILDVQRKAMSSSLPAIIFLDFQPVVFSTMVTKLIRGHGSLVGYLSTQLHLLTLIHLIRDSEVSGLFTWHLKLRLVDVMWNESLKRFLKGKILMCLFLKMFTLFCRDWRIDFP